mmetsp:Transcript_94910/g.225993  ORF Transcript_94910/g.225993 Transcript_94910/m.225993 type:complete len:281 (-) Transcript_94910:3946-4788(-)
MEQGRPEGVDGHGRCGKLPGDSLLQGQGANLLEDPGRWKAYHRQLLWHVLVRQRGVADLPGGPGERHPHWVCLAGEVSQEVRRKCGGGLGEQSRGPLWQEGPGHEVRGPHAEREGVERGHLLHPLQQQAPVRPKPTRVRLLCWHHSEVRYQAQVQGSPCRGLCANLAGHHLEDLLGRGALAALRRAQRQVRRFRGGDVAGGGQVGLPDESPDGEPPLLPIPGEGQGAGALCHLQHLRCPYHRPERPVANLLQARHFLLLRGRHELPGEGQRTVRGQRALC